MKHSFFITCAIIVIAFASASCQNNFNEPQDKQQSVEMAKRMTPNLDAINLQLDEIEHAYPIGGGINGEGRKIRKWVKWLLVGLADLGGGIVGTVANGGIVGGIVVGAICSSAAATSLFAGNSMMLTDNNNNEIELFNSLDPIYADIRYVELLPENLVGSKCGYYHNACIIDYLTENNIADFQVNDFASYIEDNLSTITNNNVIIDSELSSLLNNTNELNSIIGEITTENLYSTTDGLFTSLSDEYEEMALINRYIEFSTDLMTPEDFYRYTVEVMRTIDSTYQCEGIPLIDAEAINGAISIYYYSRHLWKTAIPDPRISNTYLTLDIYNHWRLYPNISTTNINNVLSAGDISIIGIPSFNNGVIDKLYLYKNLLYMDNSNDIDDLTSHGYIDCPAPVNVDTITCSPNNITPPPVRRYIVNSIIDTDIAFIDFENYIDNNME